MPVDTDHKFENPYLRAKKIINSTFYEYRWMQLDDWRER